MPRDEVAEAVGDQPVLAGDLALPQEPDADLPQREEAEAEAGGEKRAVLQHAEQLPGHVASRGRAAEPGDRGQGDEGRRGEARRRPDHRTPAQDRSLQDEEAQRGEHRSLEAAVAPCDQPHEGAEAGDGQGMKGVDPLRP